MAKLVKYRLFNIQSWDEGAGWVDLNSDIMNIIIGRNESGKSVLYKVLAQMFIPSQFGNKRSDLVRDGFSYGLAVFMLDSGVSIVFKININNTQEYQILYPDGTKLNASGDEPPTELAREFNWFVDSKEGVILNLLHKDTNLPFIMTSEAFNAQLLKFLTEDPRVEHIRENFEENSDRLKQAMKLCVSNADKVSYRYSAIEFIDIDSKQVVLADCQKLQTVWTPFMAALDGARTINYLPAVPPAKFTRPEILVFIDTLPVVAGLIQSVGVLHEELMGSPDEKDYSMLPVLQSLVGIETAVVQLSNWGSQLDSSLRNIPEEKDYSMLEVLADLSRLERGLRQIDTYASELHDNLLAIPQEHDYPLEGLQTLGGLWKSNHGLLSNLAGVLMGLTKHAAVSAKLKVTQEELQQMQDELGVCPTCGRSFI